MKNFIQFSILALFVLIFTNCSSNESKDIAEATILGRWQLLGFEDEIRYEFTSDKRFTLYADGNGTFPTLEEFLQENPNINGLDWYYEGDTVVVDLNFGNFSRLAPHFKCDNKVINWIQDDKTLHSTYYREEHDISACN
jgi:hypothetical protein